MPAPTKADTLDVYARAVGRVVALLRSAPSGAVPVPKLTWTIAETGAHMVSTARACLKALQTGVPVWSDHTDGAVENERLLATTPERDLAEVADALDEASGALGSAFEAHDDSPVQWIGKIRLPVSTIAGIEAGDALVHGWDISSALGRSWDISGADATVAAASAFEILPDFVDPSAAGFGATFGLHLRGGHDFTLTFDDGQLTTGDGRPARADCRISADPTAYLLSAYGRVPAWKVAATGKMIAYGRRPWLAFKLGSLLRSP